MCIQLNWQTMTNLTLPLFFMAVFAISTLKALHPTMIALYAKVLSVLLQNPGFGL